MKQVCEEEHVGPDPAISHQVEQEVPLSEEEVHSAKKKHIDKLLEKPVVKKVLRSAAATRPLSGRWVVTSRNCEAKARFTTRGYEQVLYGTEDFYGATPSLPYLKFLLVLA